MNNIKEHTLAGVEIGLQVSQMGDIKVGKFSLDGLHFYIKNTTSNPIETIVTPANNTESITTVLFPGWNPEVYKGVTGVAGLQWGR